MYIAERQSDKTVFSQGKKPECKKGSKIQKVSVVLAHLLLGRYITEINQGGRRNRPERSRVVELL